MLSRKVESLLSAARDASRNGLYGLSQALYGAATKQAKRESLKVTRELTSRWRIARIGAAVAYGSYRGDCYGPLRDASVTWARLQSAQDEEDTAALELRSWLTRSHAGAPYRVLASAA